jgi:hypothetical protein
MFYVRKMAQSGRAAAHSDRAALGRPTLMWQVLFSKVQNLQAGSSLHSEQQLPEPPHALAPGRGPWGHHSVHGPVRFVH